MRDRLPNEQASQTWHESLDAGKNVVKLNDNEFVTKLHEHSMNQYKLNMRFITLIYLPFAYSLTFIVAIFLFELIFKARFHN